MQSGMFQFDHLTKTAFQILKLKFLAFRMKQAFYPLYKQMVVKPVCINAA